jgi:DNA-binding transcriptional ArsR family regulator
MLLDRPYSVNEIAEHLTLNQYNVSKHLRILREAGLLETKKNGQQRLYGLASDFQNHLVANDHVLDLGCCAFYFDKL